MDGDNTNVWISANLCKNVSARAFRMNVENHDTKTKLMQRITVYTKPACPQCRATLRALEHFENELVRLLGIAQPQVTACVAIGRAYHRVPSVRAELIKLLK